MKLVFEDTLIKSYFSVQTLRDYFGEAASVKAHPWYSMLVITNPGIRILIDHVQLEINEPTLLFITPGQYIAFPDFSETNGYIVSFNSNFYCIEYHDSEVSCNGLLFVNHFQIVRIFLDAQQLQVFKNTITEIETEFAQSDKLLPEMLKTLLKNLLIRSSRLFRQQNLQNITDDTEVDFFRKYNSLVNKHYKEFKQVDDYAKMLGISASSLTKKMQVYGTESPSRIIKNRIITEAKRLLIYSDISVKEISFQLGYNDQHYFSRLFTKEVGVSPTEYKKQVVLA